ncbi:LIM domain kinase 1 isoform X2 [Strongylocentrotus purpuratus]|uniref:non-specific serine/threonine protein kinase n=1 Tax=Strongylocentrotus purpuratus TaxID=7668 RepID=A0A7M7PA49_STRPU|nr:LIM domain kinase 1 isoform X2 [Strongylocentrotus purpuratus]
MEAVGTLVSCQCGLSADIDSCSQCKQRLSSWYFERDKKLYCQKDYWAQFGESCQGCAQLIAGPVMVAGEHKFHPDCFVCSKCQAYIGDGDSYALVERSKLYCGPCYKKVVVLQTEKSSPKKKKKKQAHTVQLINIPPTPEGQKRFSLSLEEKQAKESSSSEDVPVAAQGKSICISDLETTPETVSLQVGDRILEVNGTPVTDHNISEIDRILSQRTSQLRITVEHGPSSNPVPDVCGIFSSRSSSEESNSPSSSNEPEFPSINNNVQASLSDCSPSSGERGRLGVFNYERRHMKLDRHGSAPKVRNNYPVMCSPTSPLSRTQSYRVSKNQRIFRPADLIKGEVLGQGFFGKAVKVTHRYTGEVMVIKELVRYSDSAQRDFLKEVKVLRSLDHYHVLKFIGVLYRDKRLNLVTEFVGGGTLENIISDLDKPFPWLQRINAARDIASGMSYLHSMGIIHRDLNSNNCLVRDDGSVVVADFGLARVFIDENDSRCPNSFGPGRDKHKPAGRKKRYTMVGTAFWMAPEMLKGKDYNERVDVFSFGIVMCELIGRVSACPDDLPRSGDFGLDEVPFMAQCCDTCPKTFHQIMLMCVRMDSDERPSFDELDQRLSSFSLHFERLSPRAKDLESYHISPTEDPPPKT